MVIPPDGSPQTVFVLPGNVPTTTQALLLGQFTITGSPSYGYSNSAPFLLGLAQWSTYAEPFSWISPKNAGNTVTFNLGGSYSSVWGFMNYEPTPNPMIEALDINLQVLESYNLNVSAPIAHFVDNQGAFRGFSSETANIHYLRLTGPIVIHSLDVAGGSLDAGGSEAPEPATLGFMLIGISLLVARLNKRRRANQLSHEKVVLR
jgi:hypothetical protein